MEVQGPSGVKSGCTVAGDDEGEGRHRAECCCEAARPPGPEPGAAEIAEGRQPPGLVKGWVETPVGKVPKVDGRWRTRDLLGALAVRLDIGRMSYRVEPGLYAVGGPGPESPVLVTASYKLSFDILRREAGALDAWILVLDTAGVNVWCAAGKGTFGTAELVHRIAETRLAEVVEHRRVIVPQLGAPGVAGFEVKKVSGFKVIWGPVDAVDLPAFLESGCRATAEMRRKSFGLGERLRLVPVELVTASQWVILAGLVLLLIGGLGSGAFLDNLLEHGLRAVVALIGGVLAGAVVMPAMLPWLPGRSFALKGLWPGLAVALALQLGMGGPGGWAGRLEGGAWLLMVPAVSAFLAMGFTGASTFTSLSGVQKEMRVAVPMQISAASLGVVLWLASRLVA